MMYVGIFTIGFIASLVNAIAGGGGGIISIPFLIFSGLPPHFAIATNRFGALGMGMSTIYKYFKNKQIIFHYLFPLAFVGIVGSLIGANILVRINPVFLKKLIAILILMIIPIIFLKSQIGINRKSVSIKSKITSYVSYFFISIYDSFFGVGSGLLAIFSLTSLLGITFLEANATEKVAWILNATISVIIFASYGLINYKIGIVLLVGMFVGGYTGASIALRKGNDFVKVFLSFVIIITVIKLLLL